jgi:hypothetical protein
MDLNIPDKLWEMIRPAKRPAGDGFINPINLLCSRCIVTKLEAMDEYMCLNADTDKLGKIIDEQRDENQDLQDKVWNLEEQLEKCHDCENKDREIHDMSEKLYQYQTIYGSYDKLSLGQINEIIDKMVN